MTHFDRENVEHIVESLHKEMVQEFEELVLQNFMKISDDKFQSMGLSHLFKNEVLNRFFLNSTFKELLEEDPDYVFDFSGNYWSQHVLKEIENTIDLERLKMDEELKSIGNINSFRLGRGFYESSYLGVTKLSKKIKSPKIRGAQRFKHYLMSEISSKKTSEVELIQILYSNTDESIVILRESESIVRTEIENLNTFDIEETNNFRAVTLVSPENNLSSEKYLYNQNSV